MIVKYLCDTIMMIKHLSFAPLWGDCRNTSKEPRGNGANLVFLLSSQGRELFSFGNYFAGPQRHTQGICSGFGQRHMAPRKYIIIPNA